MEKIIKILVDKGHKVSFYINGHNWYTMEIEDTQFYGETFDDLEEIILNEFLEL